LNEYVYIADHEGKEEKAIKKHGPARSGVLVEDIGGAYKDRTCLRLKTGTIGNQVQDCLWTHLSPWNIANLV
jgi:hypothetical protein